jgi:hypothetical protein
MKLGRALKDAALVAVAAPVLLFVVPFVMVLVQDVVIALFPFAILLALVIGVVTTLVAGVAWVMKQIMDLRVDVLERRID